MTISEKLDKKIDHEADSFCADKDKIKFTQWLNDTKHYKQGSLLLKPMLLDMYELVNDLEPSVLPESHRDKRRSILNKFNEFIKE